MNKHRKTRKIPLIFLFLLAAVPLLFAEEEVPDMQEEASSGGEPSGLSSPSEQTEVSEPSPREIVMLTGIPVRALEISPSLLAVFALTESQIKDLRAAHEETVGQAKNLLREGDDKAARRQLGKAQRDFLTVRKALLTERQLTLIENTKAVLKEINVNTIKRPEQGQAFEEAIRSLLTPEEIQIMEGAQKK